MNANLTPGIDTGKVLNLRHLLTTLAIVIVVVWIMQKIGKQSVILYDSAGKETGRGEIKYSLKPLKK
jgi:hypothetical protein